MAIVTLMMEYIAYNAIAFNWKLISIVDVISNSPVFSFESSPVTSPFKN